MYEIQECISYRPNLLKENSKYLQSHVLVAYITQWLLVDVYMDTASGKEGTARKEFARMLEDCKAHKIEIILIKNISRFGRDIVGILEALNHNTNSQRFGTQFSKR